MILNCFFKKLRATSILSCYSLNTKKYDYLPFNESDQFSVRPIYKTLPGWSKSTFGTQKWSQLPQNAKNYILFLESLISTKISIISTGPERNQTIDRKNILSKI